MTEKEFYKNLLGILPYTEDEDKPFRTRLSNVLKRYQDWVDELTVNGNSIDKVTKKTVSKICEQLNNIVKSSMKGLSATAYTQLRNLLQDSKKEKKLIDVTTIIIKVPKGKNFYRIRKMDCVYRTERKELFHIPLNKRGIIKTQRYSSPGYPCLYLGESIYGCWEEMRRPPMYSCAVSRFVNQYDAHFLDLTIPAQEKAFEQNYLTIYPLIISCMIRVANDESIYKPEYIIPQLLIEWILKQRNDKRIVGDIKIHGVMYTSTHRDKDFHFPLGKTTNYAIPVFDLDDSKTYCKKLTTDYYLTPPTTHEIERMKAGYKPIISEESLPEGLTEDEKAYYLSNFGQLETLINDNNVSPPSRLTPRYKAKLLNVYR